MTGPGTVSRRAERRQETIAEIKEHARRQLATLGPGGLSLRGIAREMRTASSALYRYFPSQDDLLNTLVLDAYNSLADALAPTTEAEGTDAATRMWNLAHAFREWALSHRGDFTLIFGTPVPGYEAPEEVTGPAAGRALAGWVGAYSTAVYAGVANAGGTPAVGVAAGELLRSLISAVAADCPPEHAVVALGGYLSLLGVLITEIFGSLSRLVADLDAFYEAQVRTAMLGMGFDPARIPGATDRR